MPFSYNLSAMFRTAITSLILLVVFFVCNPATGPQANSDTAGGSLRWAYLSPASFRSPAIKERLALYSHLTLGVWRLNAQGELYARPKLAPKAWAHLNQARKSSRLYPLISLKNAGAGAKLLASEARRNRAVAALGQLVLKHKFDGLHIDFEFLTGKSTAGYVAFLEALKKAGYMPGKTLSIAIFPPEKGTPGERAFHDITKLGPVIDEVVYMTYDYHLKTPGPVTGVEWARRNMKAALKSIAPEKVWLGLPAYGYEWRLGKKSRPKVITESGGAKLCGKYGCTRHASGMLRLKRPGRVAYIPDRKLHKDFYSLARELGVKGTAMWRLGFEKYP